MMMSVRQRTAVGAMCLLTLGVGPPVALSAQARADVTSREFLMIGYHSLNLDELNTRLMGAGFPQPSTNFFTIGAASYKTKGRFLLGAEGHYVAGSDERVGDTETRITGGQVQFTLGYDAYSTSSFSIYPAVGIGGSGLNFDLVERGEIAFDDLLTDPVRSVRITSIGFLLDASVGMEFRPAFASTGDPSGGGLQLGIRSGYSFAPGGSDLERHGNDRVRDGPDMAIEGLYVRFTIGGWSGRGGESGTN